MRACFAIVIMRMLKRIQESMTQERVQNENDVRFLMSHGTRLMTSLPF